MIFGEAKIKEIARIYMNSLEDGSFIMSTYPEDDSFTRLSHSKDNESRDLLLPIKQKDQCGSNLLINNLLSY